MSDAHTSTSDEAAVAAAAGLGDSSRGDRFGSGGVMSFGDHLEELRSYCIRALLGLIAATCFSLWFADEILALLLQPVLVVLDAHGQRPEIQALSPPDTFVMYLKMALLSGLILAMPWILWQVWRFVALGLYEREQRFLRLFTPVSLLLFAAGVSFMYLVVLPVVLNFFVTFGEKIEITSLKPSAIQQWIIGASEQVETEQDVLPPAPPDIVPLLAANPVEPSPGAVWFNTTRNALCVQTENGLRTTIMQPAEHVSAVKSQFGLSFYVSFVLMLSLAFGIAFELPLAVIFITSLGILSVDELAGARRYVIVGLVFAAALLTPPDVISQLLLAVPMVMLFEGGIIASRVLEKQRAT